ncbi:hypothetical protein GCM10027169_20960 [Gordonia jinhuaensis]|uniref:FHA domain-containing protein n=1 Tax=Gordonia jinhuaensis TaxID=1517702 RepID=A0A916TG15_9ACTN|nr:hypothetical protein [Gordonia jinhuaensis]GGB43515.1 hypothetical protein GCM10011489_33790 [Gordonia jinhuaensis]
MSSGSRSGNPAREATDDGADYVEFCGERYRLPADRPFHIGREGDLAVDDNPYLHRRFLVAYNDSGTWWLTNEGRHVSVSVSAPDAGFRATLAPGATMPLAFGTNTVVFSAGSTTYELEIHTAAAPPSHRDEQAVLDGEVTLGVPALTESQKVLIVALAEPVLRREGTDATAIPSSSQAAARLGWSLTKFNRKLDNVCDKFDQIGVSGLRAGGGRLATNRRARLVEYAVTSRLVNRDDLAMIDIEAQRNTP